MPGLAMLAVVAIAVIALGVRLALPGPAAADSGRECSTRDIAGSWLFATQVGQLSTLAGLPFAGDVTAIGTMNIDREGNLEGEFDLTVADAFSLPGNTYSGTVTVEPDCTGTLTFVTGAGAMRTDRIAVLNDSEMWGMSLDPFTLWTYEIRRISDYDDDHDDDDDD